MLKLQITNFKISAGTRRGVSPLLRGADTADVAGGSAGCVGNWKNIKKILTKY